MTTFRRPPLSGSESNLDQRDPDPIQIDPDSDPDPDSAFRAQLLQTIRCSERMSKAELDDCHDKIRVWLIANGTIKRAKICELCDVSTKQAKTIIDSFCKKYSVSIQGAGRSTTYKWND